LNTPVTPDAVVSRLSPSLATQLHHTARCVLAVEQGHSLSEILPQVAADLRPGVQALTFHVLRRLGTSRALVARLAPRKPDPAVQAMLCCAVALLVDEPGIAPTTTAARYPPHTVVNQAVEAVRQQRSTQRAAAFVNACLRRLLRERDALMQAVSAEVEARWNHPRWWVELLQRDHPDHWQAILQANNRPGPMTLRVNRRLTDVASYQQALLAKDMPARRVGDGGLELEAPQPVDRLPGFADGLCSVQDAAAQRAAPLLLAGLEVLAGLRVLDACAAPGGKTAHLLECADLDLLALDLDPKRCNRVTDTLQRLRLHAEVRAADAAHPAGWWDGRPFDAILLDAPCTASGIVRRHPDVRWLRRASDVTQLATVQQRLLEALWPLLKPGGRLVYATCSVFRAEGSGQVASFLERHTEAVLWPSPGHLLPGNVGDPAGFHDNEPGGPDGFFYARIDKALA
jgi:16S rRNA (cytosine967-C5)-methyltransferase